VGHPLLPAAGMIGLFGESVACGEVMSFVPKESRVTASSSPCISSTICAMSELTNRSSGYTGVSVFADSFLVAGSVEGMCAWQRGGALLADIDIDAAIIQHNDMLPV